MSATALLVIDMLNDFFRDAPLASQRVQLAENINRLIAHSRTQNIQIIWVRQEFKPDLSDAFPVMRKRDIRITIADTDGCNILAELDRQPHDHEIIKKRYSAFFDTTLDDLLDQLKTKQVIMAGVNTHACVRTAAIDAYQRDYEVVIARQCVSSYDAEHHDVTLRYLENGIADVKELSDLIPSA